MTFSLRTKDNIPLLDIEYWIENDNLLEQNYLEISSSIYLKNYSQHLLSIVPDSRLNRFINIFEELSEIRKWLWEDVFKGRHNTSEAYEEVLLQLREKLEHACKYTGTIVVRD